MNREQAHAAIYDAWDRALNGSRQIGLRKQAEGFAAALEALGLLKLDTPEGVHKEGVEFIATMAQFASWQRPEVVAEDLAKQGLRIVRAP